MKKSTLITTIAMIVVVVVALSTATYAWFSSSSTAVANVQFQTNASGDWSMIQGAIAYDTTGAEPAYTLTYAGAAEDNINLTATTIQSGLWCPTAAIATTIADSQASTTISAPAGFAQATKTGGNYQLAKLQTAAYDSENTTIGNGLAYPFALRVLNVSGMRKTLQLNITLNAGSDGTNNSMYAAAAVRFYIYEKMSTGTGNAYTSGYEFTDTAGLNSATGISGNITQDSTGTPMTNSLGAKTAYNTDTETYTTTPVQLADYTAGDISRSFSNPAAIAIDSLGIAQGDRYLTYTFDMGDYAAGAFSNVIIYIWIDGWVANSSAQSANFKINFGFTSNSVVNAVVNA